MANPSNTLRMNVASNVTRTMRMPQVRHMKEIFRGGLQVANTSLGIPVSARITIRRR